MYIHDRIEKPFLNISIDGMLVILSQMPLICIYLVFWKDCDCHYDEAFVYLQYILYIQPYRIVRDSAGKEVASG